MDTQQVQDKVKSNGKWASRELNEVTNRGGEVLEAIQEALSEILHNGSRSAQALTKKYPMQATLGGIAVGFILGAWLFRSSSKAA